MSASPKVKEVFKFDVEVVNGPHSGMKLNFNKTTVTIGRGPENDIVLANDPRVSRQHAEFKQRGSVELVIVNLSPKNFVLVNGQSIQSEFLTNESVIQIGDTEMRVRLELATPAPVAVVTPVKPVNLAAIPSVPTPVAPPPVVPRQQSARGASPAYSAPSYSSAAPPRDGGGLLANPKARFYGIVGIVIILGWLVLSPSAKKDNKDPNAIRTSVISMQDVVDAEKRSQELLTVKKEKYDSIQYRRAQENFVKGFRDFQQGQYARAREAFQVVLNLDPDNELAKRYYHLSKIKFDELVKFNMIQGNRYREKKNWRMCQSNYSNVMTMLQNRKEDPTFKEAKQFYEECTLNLEGRF